MAVNNALNITSAGLQRFDGSATFSANTVTQYGVLTGDASNAISSIAAVAAGRAFQSGGAAANPSYSTPTFPSTSGTSGKILVSDGINNVYSTPKFPNASATSRKRIVSDGTDWVASTETWAVPGTNTNVLTSDGTNWTSATSKYGYDLHWSTASSGAPVASSTYFFMTGSAMIAFTSWTNSATYFITQSGTITAFRARFFVSGSPTSELSTLYIRVNNTTDNAIYSTLNMATGASFNISNTSLSIAVTAGDYISLKWITPAWVTAPSANSTFSGTIFIST